MGNINKKYIIREAENILEECRKKSTYDNSDKNKIIKLKVHNNRLKRKNLLLKICLFSLTLMLLVIMCIK